MQMQKLKQQKPKKTSQAEVSELRQDPVSKEWVVVAVGRAKRPNAFRKLCRPTYKQPRRKCPFCNLEKKEYKPDKVILKKNLNLKTKFAKKLEKTGDLQIWKGKPWSTIVIPNKYPSFIQGSKLTSQTKGPFTILPGRGYHEVLITASHNLSFGQLPTEKLVEIIDCYHQRYLDLRKRQFIRYVSIIHNHGREAGASLTHPHSQIFAIPIMPRDIHRSLRGSKQYFRKTNRCVHCDMIAWEKKEKTRIIYENKDFILLAPFVPTVAFETRIYPKKHQAYFEKITKSEKQNLAKCFKKALYKLYKALNDPPYNFFLHTAPCDNKEDYGHYHWHFEILPKITIWAGFELATGIEISTVDPCQAAQILKKA